MSMAFALVVPVLLILGHLLAKPGPPCPCRFCWKTRATE